jgi:hypothetical protein
MITFNYLKFPILGIFAFLAFSCASDENQTPEPISTEISLLSKDLDENSFAYAKGFSTAHNKLLADIRRATAKYHRVEVAEADGYIGDTHCVSSPAGGMGFHFVKQSLFFDGIIDPSMPEILVYEPQKNGRLKLVAIEFVMPAAVWPHNDPPKLGDQVFDDHTAPGSPGPPFPHYQIHAWVWKNNPSGIHTPFNSNVTCEYAH